MKSRNHNHKIVEGISPGSSDHGQIFEKLGAWFVHIPNGNKHE